MELIEEGSAPNEEASLGRFLAAHGGPFYGLQQQLGLLREDAFRACEFSNSFDVRDAQQRI